MDKRRSVWHLHLANYFLTIFHTIRQAGELRQISQNKGSISIPIRSHAGSSSGSVNGAAVEFERQRYICVSGLSSSTVANFLLREMRKTYFTLHFAQNSKNGKTVIKMLF